MARKVRIGYPGAIYPVMNRGDRREAIYEDDEDRQRLSLGSRGPLAWLLQPRAKGTLAALTDLCLLEI